MTARVLRHLHDDQDGRQYRDAGLWQDRTLPEIVDEWADLHPDRIAVSDGTLTWTYAELRDLSLRAAQLFLDLDIGRRDAVALQERGSAALAVLNLAAHRVGAVFMPLSTQWRAELRPLMTTGKAPLLVVPDAEPDRDFILQAREVVPREHTRALHTTTSFLDAIRTKPPASGADLAARRPSPDEPLHAMCSSGTTGEPKVSVWSHNNLFAHLTDHHARTLGRRPGEVAAGLAPPSTGSTGYIFTILACLLHGDTAHVQYRWSPREALELMAARSCTYAVTVPTQLVMLLQEDIESYDLSSLRAITTAGASLPFATAVAVEDRLGVHLSTAYGTSDGGTPLFGSVSDPRNKRLRTVGKVQRAEELRVLDPLGEDVDPGEVGELVWRGPTKSWGYLDQPDLDVAAFDENGWFYSGDLGSVDDDGYVTIRGRSKDMILRGGVNIFPAEVEELLAEHGAVAEVSIIAVPDARLGESACAVVVPNARAQVRLEDLVAHLEDRGLARYKWPESLMVLSELPKNAGGKVDKGALRRIAADDLPAAT